MESLLLEIGTEEIPAGYIEPALKALAEKILQKLANARIDCGRAEVYGTPRRLAVIVERVAGRQAPLRTEVLGPPERIGFDADGRPTLAALKFAEKIGIPIGRVGRKQTDKGTYLCAVQTERALATRSILKQLIPEIIPTLPFPKTMKWADQELLFARPIHTIVCLYGRQVVPFTLGNIRSGRSTCGHSFVRPGRIPVAAADRYVSVLSDAHVVVDMSRRRAWIEKDIAAAAEGLGGRVLPDAELVDVVANLVEYPAVVTGTFDAKFLELPREILITAMREHQKYFAVSDRQGQLMPGFIAVNNTPASDMALVAKGHERVLRARLEDARFFYQSDLETPLDRCVEKLKGVLFQAALGSMYDKAMRIRRLVEQIGAMLPAVDGKGAAPAELTKLAARAAQLCKADLVSQVVGEFPKLQGVMGRIYALAAGESPDVAAAIEEHYRPTYSGGALPETLPGALLGIADKMDSICGCFSAGLIPTGASDPYALRRQGIGIVQIMLANGLTFSLQALINNSLALFGGADEKPVGQTAADVYDFIRNRIANLLGEEGYPRDMIAAVVSISVDHIPHVWSRVKALSILREKPDFEPLAVAFKRVVNIIRQAGQKGLIDGDGAVDERLFAHPSETALYESFQRVAASVRQKLDRNLIEAALLDIASLRETVDGFFDGVLVMADDPALRRNRLALLGRIAQLFARFADFSKIST